MTVLAEQVEIGTWIRFAGAHVGQIGHKDACRVQVFERGVQAATIADPEGRSHYAGGRDISRGTEVEVLDYTGTAPPPGPDKSSPTPASPEAADTQPRRRRAKEAGVVAALDQPSGRAGNKPLAAPITEVLRWLGGQGITIPEANAVLAAVGVEAAERTVRKNIRAGARHATLGTDNSLPAALRGRLALILSDIIGKRK